jgi:hypothetical protein
MRFRRCVAAILFLIGTSAIVLLDMGGARLFGNDAFANVVSFTIKPSPQQNFPTSRPPASENSIGSYAPPAVQPHKHLTPISDTGTVAFTALRARIMRARKAVNKAARFPITWNHGIEKEALKLSSWSRSESMSSGRPVETCDALLLWRE